MGLYYSIEPWDSYSLRHLIPEHYAELGLNQDKVKLNPDWATYQTLADKEQLLYVTVRDNAHDQIVGYFIGFIMPELHYKDVLALTMDIFYVHPDYRKGRAGVRLFQTVEKEAKRRGVKRIHVGSKMHKDASVLFKYLNYDPVETYYSKWVGE